ncbi:adenosine deaminase [Hydra vulgaris]|uniref:adenosine deaminase n=1 Tax=Hydra vulgaris TaxID=6087 RepID=UPI00064113AA|nr:adenosine deaminase [Hydra vulgaris]XP_047125523.1 adenosine deaminase [Hydra vulgaris]XP_047125524.1 adenosine deaminase [Hydra vulgaris]
MATSAEEKELAVRNLLKTAPKPQLHIHLDGSLSFDFIKSSAKRMKLQEPERFASLFPLNIENLSENEISNYLWSLKEVQHIQGDIVSGNGNWKMFDFCNQFLQTKLDLKEAVYDLVMRQHREYGVNYIEIRFAPKLHNLCGLSDKEVVTSTLDGFESAKKDLSNIGVHLNGGLILCALRSHSVEDAKNVLKLVLETNALGFDIAGDEGSYPLLLFEGVLREAKNQGCFITVHAGEWSSLDYPTVQDNLRLAVDIGVHRIGHGLDLKNSPENLINDVLLKDIGVEVCLTENCGNPDRCTGYADHPIKYMLENKIKVCGLNCDNTLLSGNRIIGRPDPLTECVRALLRVKVAPNALVEIIENAYKSGFQNDALKQAVESGKVWRENYLPKLIEIMNE